MHKIEIDAVPAPQTHKEIHIALDFDGTLAHYDKWEGQYNKVGEPVAKMVAHVKEWLKRGYKVTIFTARLSHSPIESQESIEAIQKFLVSNGLPILPITCMKMHYFTHFVDDKAYHVTKNTGEIHGLNEFKVLD